MDVRFWDDVNKLFHRRSNIFYCQGSAFPAESAMAATHGWLSNSGLASGGEPNIAYKAVYATGSSSNPRVANFKSVGQEITVGSKPCIVIPGTKITRNGTTTVEEVEFQYTVQTGDDHSDIVTNLADGITAYLDADDLPDNFQVRCTLPAANDTEIVAGLLLKFNNGSPTPPELVAAVATGDVLKINYKGTTTSGENEAGSLVRDKPPSPLNFAAMGVPKVAGIRHFGYTRAFKGSFSGTEAEILSDQALPPIEKYLNAQSANCTFELVQDNDPTLLEVVSGTAHLTNDGTRDYVIPLASGVQSTYSLFFVTPNNKGYGYDYLWVYRARSAQLDFAREQRQHNPIQVTANADLFLGRADICAVYSIAYSL